MARFTFLLKIQDMAGTFPGMYMMDKLLTLWPSVEFQIGPEHKLVEKQRRIWVINAILFGILPHYCPVNTRTNSFGWGQEGDVLHIINLLRW